MELVHSFSVLHARNSGAPSAPRVWVASFAQSPRAGAIACGYSDGAVTLWDANTESVQGLIWVSDADRRSDAILSVVFSPDGSLLVSTNHGHKPDRAACVWDVQTGTLIHRLGEFDYRLHAAAFSPDGRVLALTGDDKVVELYDVMTGSKLEWGFPRLPYAGSALAFSPDGHFLVVGGDGELLCIYDLVEGTARRLEGHVEWTYALAFHPQGHFFASGGEDALVRLWEIETGRQVRELSGHGAPGKEWGGIAYDVSFSADGRLLASASADMTVRLWDAATGNLVETLAHPRHSSGDDVCWASFQRGSGDLLIGTYSGQVYVWRRLSEPQVASR